MCVPFDASFPGRPLARFLPNPKLRFLAQCREVLRYKQMSHRTEEALGVELKNIQSGRHGRPHLPGVGRFTAGRASPRLGQSSSFALPLVGRRCRAA